MLDEGVTLGGMTKSTEDRIRRGGLSVCIIDAWCSVTVRIDG